MAETNGAQGAAAGAQSPTFQLQRVYLKDVSLELPHAPQIFLEQEGPQVDVQLEVGNERVPEGIFEVTIRVTTTAKVKDKVLFLVEAKQGGIFEIRNIASEQLEAVLGIVCPGIVYPYLRANVADLINRTGLPPIHLAEIKFASMYQHRLAQQQQQTAAQPTSPAVKQ
jgi:preprotein translocase subunit SecB